MRREDIVECYVVRIYRRDRKDPSRAEGVVEGTGGEALKVFHSVGELLNGLKLPADKAQDRLTRRSTLKRGNVREKK